MTNMSNFCGNGDITKIYVVSEPTPGSDNYVTGGTYSNGTLILNRQNGSVIITGFTSTDTFVTGFTYDNYVITLSQNQGQPNLFITLPSFITGFTDTFVTGGTYSNGNLILERQNGSVVITGLTSTDTFVTGFTYNNANTLTISQNQGSSDLTVNISVMTGLTVSGVLSASTIIGDSLGVSGDCFTDLFVSNINSCSPLHIQPNNVGDVLIGENGGVNVGIGTNVPNSKLTVSGKTTTTNLQVTSGATNGYVLVSDLLGNAIWSPVTSTAGYSDYYVTGGTYASGNLTLNRQNGTVSIGGFPTSIGGGGAGGKIFYFNISKTQSPYYEFSVSGTSSSEQTITSTVSSNSTALIAGFMTPVGEPKVTVIPAGIIGFYLHCYNDLANYNFNVYVELYKRTTGGTETFLFSSDPAPVVSTTTEMVVTDGFFSGATLDITDKLVAKVYAENITNQNRSFSFVSEGSQHYSFSLTTIPSWTDIYVIGGTTLGSSNATPDATISLEYNQDIPNGTYSLPYKDTYITGGTYNGGTLILTRNDSVGVEITGLTSTNTFVTGFTFNIGTYDLTILQNSGLPPLTQNLGILASDITVTGGTYNPSNGVATFYNNIGGSFQVPGFITGFTDIYLSSGTFNNNTGNLTLTRTDNVNVTITGFTDYFVTGGTFNNNTLTLNRQNGNVTVTGFTDNFVTGGTFSSGTLTLNRQNGSVTITGFTATDTFVTGFTYSNNNLTISRNQGQPILNVTINNFTGLTINGSLSATTYLGLPVTTDNFVTGGTFNSVTNTLTLNRQNGSVSITGFTTGTSGTDNFVTGGTFNSGTGTLTLNRQNGSVNVTGFTTGTSGVDTYVTGFTYNSVNAQLTILQNQGQPPLSVTVSVSSSSPASITLFNYYNFI